MTQSKKNVASSLLKINAVKLSPEAPFTWASGWHSPIYCDNRKTLSYPEVRRQIYEEFSSLIAEKYPEVELIAGVATGAIAHGVLVAEHMNKPFIYVRSAPKSHGLTNQVEGFYQKGQKVVVIEDLVSTGSSSLNAVEALRDAGCEVLGMVAIFTYGFPQAAENFKNANVQLDTLTDYGTMIEMAVEQDYVKENQLDTLKQWRLQPETWGR